MNEESIENKIKELNVGAFKDVLFDFLFPLIGLAITVLLFFFYMKPTYTEMKELETELSTQSGVLATLNTKVGALSKLTDFNDVLKENSEMVEKLYVSESNVPQLLDQIHQISTNAGMMVDRMNYSYSDAGAKDAAAQGKSADATAELRTDDTSGIVNVAATVIGTYEQLQVFMQEIEKAARFTYVTTFRFGASTEEGKEGQFSVNVNVDSPYMYVQSVAVTDDPIKLDILNPKFVEFINSIKEYKYYDFLNQQIVAEEVESIEEPEEETLFPAGTVEEQPVAEESEEPAEEDTPFGF